MEPFERFGPRIDAREVFVRDRGVLLALLRDLAPDEWQRPTAAAPWTVHDVVAHMLGDDLGRLSRTRDDHAPLRPAPGESLAPFLNRINGEWVVAARRLSPTLLVDLFAHASTEVLAMWQEADLDRVGGAVSWAGPDPAPAWLDCAREFTEYWVHQQQIREATGRDDTGGADRGAIHGADVVHTVLDTFLRAVPHTLARHPRPDGTTLAVVVDGAAGGRWSWRCAGERWRWAPHLDEPATRVVFPEPDPLWRLCVRMVEPGQVRRRVSVSGDEALAGALLQIVSIIR